MDSEIGVELSHKLNEGEGVWSNRGLSFIDKIMVLEDIIVLLVLYDLESWVVNPSKKKSGSVRYENVLGVSGRLWG